MGEEYVVSCDILELPKGSAFTTLPGPVEPGQLALLDVEGWLIPGRWDGFNTLELPGLLLELGCAYRVIGRVIPIDEETAFDCPN